MRPVRGAIALGAFAWLAACALALSGCGPQTAEPLTAFDGRVEDWTREILVDSPELATRAGVTLETVGAPFNDRLDDRSPIAWETRRAAALRRLTELRALNESTLPKDDQLTARILDAQFSNAADGAAFAYGDFTPLGGIHPYVLNQLDSAFITLPEFFDTDHLIDTPGDAEAYLQRLSSVDAAIDQETERARLDAEQDVIPPAAIIEATLVQLDHVIGTPLAAQVYVTSFRRKLDLLVARETNPAAQQRARVRALALIAQAERITQNEIVPAHQRQAAFLRALYPRSSQDVGVWRLPQGDAYYRAALRIETSTDLAPSEIHRIGLERVNRLSQQLDVALRRIGMTEGSVGQRMAILTADPRYRYAADDAGRSQLMADTQARINRVYQLAPRWFGALPRARLEVRRVPAVAEAGSSGAYYSAPSLDGRTPGIYYINLADLSDMTKIDLPTQDFHEAVPGHHFQVALAQEQTQIPLLRRLLGFSAYSEGWGLYAEEFADEQGLFESDPIGRIGFLRWQLWRAARLVVDTGIHAQRWSRQQAIDYLTQTVGDTPSTIGNEVDRYIAWPGQACAYELGRREIMRLREEARNALGPDFDLRAFHDVVLLNGEVPLSVLDDLVGDWIPAQRSHARREARRRD
jgi:uncharacterized protein (DUF885 family)